MAPLILAVLLALGTYPESAAAAAPPKTIKVATINAAALPLIHRRLPRRMVEIGREIAERGYDLVSVQEAWRDGDSAEIARVAGLPYSARVPRSGPPLPLRTGLTILSRWPVLLKEERSFSARRPSVFRITQGEPFAHKGYLMARIDAPGGQLDFYAVHTLSNYPGVRYRTLRMTELFELAEGILELSVDRSFIIGGDLNCGPGDPEYDVFMDLLGLHDLCIGSSSCVDPKHKTRIDHLFIPGPLNATARLAFADELDGVPPPAYSDHFGYDAELPRARLLALRARPDRVKRAKALKAVSNMIDELIARMDAERARGSWIPFYARLRSGRHAAQESRLRAVQARVRRALDAR